VQEELFHEDINAALNHVIAAIGGMKAVGVELWPSLSADKAGRKVADCLNSDRAQQFHPDELIWILSEARKKGVHSAMAFITGECGYADPVPVEPEDEAAKLQREFIAAQAQMTQMLKRMEKLNLPVVRGVA
jgi:hypothetical protein